MRLNFNSNLVTNKVKSSLNFTSSTTTSANKMASKACKKGLMLGMMLLATANMATLTAKSKKTLASENNVVNKFSDNTFGMSGTYYSNLIPENESIEEHFDCLNQIKSLYTDIQGCEYKNPAMLNGISIDDLKSKALVPAQKLANNEKFGANQNTLVLMSFNEKADPTNAFKYNLASTAFNSTEDSIGRVGFNFDETFLEHYDNIILLQPNNNATADSTLDNLFAKLDNCLEDTSKVDVAFIGHGINRTGVRLSTNKDSETSKMDLSDFNPIENGGNSFAQNMKNIFVKSINNGYNPRVIGMGCSTDFMQTAMDKIMPEEYQNSVKVFGTPYATKGNYVIGFNNDSLEMLVLVDAIKNNKGLIIDIEDANMKDQNDKLVNSFMIYPNSKSDSSNMHIINNYYQNNISSGSLSKDSGVTMNYYIKTY